MTQTRLYLEAGEADARKAGELVENEFADDSFAIALFESGEMENRWCLSVYVETQRAGELARRFSALLATAGMPARVDREEIGDTDWVAQSLAGLSPVRAGRYVVHGSHDRDYPKAHELAILIDAGLAFGTGHHGTTAGCLEAIGQRFKRRNYRRALDLGSGSGVLAIGIAKSLKRKVLASDIDPVAVSVARGNCAINGVGGLVRCIHSAGFNHREIAARAPFDLIVANILAGPLQAMANAFSRHTRSGATIVLSGLLPAQRARILASFRMQGFVHRRTLLKEGWLTLVLEKAGQATRSAFARPQ